MTWVAEETFEGYSDEANIAGQTGGSGWSAGWTNNASKIIPSDTALASEGSVSARTNNGTASNTYYQRLLSTAISTDGVCYVSLASSQQTGGQNAFALRSSAGGRVQTRLYNGYLQYYNVSWTNITPFTNSQFIDVRITFSVTSSNFSVSYWTGSAWATDTSNASMLGSGNIDRISIAGDTGGGNFWIDNITGTDPNASGTDYPLTAVVGAFTLSGIATGLLQGLNMVASAGAFVLTGIANTFTTGKGFVAETGAFILTGTGTAFKTAVSMVASAGSFALTGVAVALTYTQATTEIIADTAEYVFTGNDAILRPSNIVKNVSKFVASVTNRSKS